jgi:hypothetical protein
MRRVIDSESGANVQHLWELLKSVWSEAAGMQNRQGYWPFVLEQFKERRM